MNHAKITDQGLLIASGDPTKNSSIKESNFLSDVGPDTYADHMKRLFRVLSAWNNRNTAFCFNGNKLFAVISFISKHIAVLSIKQVHQVYGWCMVTDLTAREVNQDRVASCIDYSMDFGDLSSSGTADSLFLGPPFPPAACW